MDPYNVVMFVFGVIFIIIQGLLVNYLVKLERVGCQCAMDWRRGFIMFFLILSITYTLSSFVIDSNSIPLLQTVMVIAGLVNAILTLQYVHNLKKVKCACSESVYRDVMTFIAIFNAIIYSLVLTLLIYFVFSMANFSRKKMRNFKPKKGMSIRSMKRPS